MSDKLKLSTSTISLYLKKNNIKRKVNKGRAPSKFSSRAKKLIIKGFENGKFLTSTDARKYFLINLI